MCMTSNYDSVFCLFFKILIFSIIVDLHILSISAVQQSDPVRVFLFVCFLFRATPVAYGDSQARGLIRAVAACLRQSHSNTGSEPHLRATPQFTAMPDP